MEWVDNDGQSVTLYFRLSDQAGCSRDGLLEVQGEKAEEAKAAGEPWDRG